MLNNAYLVENIGIDTAENELAKNLQIFMLIVYNLQKVKVS